MALLKLRLDHIEQLAIDDGGVLSGIVCALVWDFTDVDFIAQDVEERAALHRHAAAHYARLAHGALRQDALVSQFTAQQMHRSQLQIALINAAYRDAQTALKERLAAQAARHHQAQAICAYIAAADGSAAATAADYVGWRTWALAQADAMDPLLDGSAPFARLPPIEAWTWRGR